jgi:CopG family nickel-responsive transcriptional regulator
MSGELERFGVSMEAELLEKFDQLLQEKGYSSRSEALRDLVRGWINDEMSVEDPSQPAMGTLTLFYDHTRRELADRLTDIGHDHHQLILTTLHFHIDHQRCLEVMALKGTVGELRRLADRMIAIRGVENGRMVLTVQSEGADHGHSHAAGHKHSHNSGPRGLPSARKVRS